VERIPLDSPNGRDPNGPTRLDAIIQLVLLDWHPDLFFSQTPSSHQQQRMILPGEISSNNFNFIDLTRTGLTTFEEHKRGS
jgi:hypothetical protein